jgi:hypothetical protein
MPFEVAKGSGRWWSESLDHVAETFAGSFVAKQRRVSLIIERHVFTHA